MAIEDFLEPDWKKTREAWDRVLKFVEFTELYFDKYPLEEADRRKERVREEGLKTLSDLDEMEGECQKESKMLFNFFKGRVANVLPNEEFGSQAEMYLGRALKLNENFAPAWNEMGDWAWKRGNISDARKYFEYALDHDPNNKDALRNMAMLVRHRTSEKYDEERIEESIALAHKSLDVDATDGNSWVVLGNSYLCLFFNARPSPDVLRKAMDAYAKAEADPRVKYQPDLYYNQAVLLKYEEDYARCLDRLDWARSLDPDWDVPKTTLESLVAYLDLLESLVSTRGRTKDKKLKQLLKTLREKDALGPYRDGCFRSPSGASATLVKTPFRDLARGENREKVVCGVVVCSVNTQDYIPFTFCMVDESSECIAVTVYNFARGKGVIIGNTVAIPDPFVEVVDFKFKEKAWSFRSIRVETPLVLVVNGKKVTRAQVGSSFFSSAGLYA